MHTCAYIIHTTCTATNVKKKGKIIMFMNEKMNFLVPSNATPLRGGGGG